jgi:N-acetylneuraminic acid mutarotase
MPEQVKGNMSCSRRGAAAAAINGQIWVVGGWDGQAYLKAVEVFDMATGRWSQVKSMLEPRCYAAMAVMDGKVYVAGGYYGQVNLDSVEMYDSVTDEWKALPRMACPRRGLGLAALNGHLYAVGGWDGKHNLASVESFSSMTGTWRRVPELATARSSVAVAVNGGSLYAIGGWDGKNFLSSVECYAPIYGTVRNPVGEWRTLAPMNVPRSYASAVAVGSRVLVLGGWDGTDGRRLDSVEVSFCLCVFAYFDVRVPTLCACVCVPASVCSYFRVRMCVYVCVILFLEVPCPLQVP